MTAVNNWNHERAPVLRDDGTVRFDSVTSGNFAGVDLTFDSAGATIDVNANLVLGAVRLGDLGLEDKVLDAGGLERAIVIRRLPDELSATAMRREIDLSAAIGDDAPVWVRVMTLDGHQAWSSPIYLFRD